MAYIKSLSDGGIKPLTNLTYLNLICNENITDEGIKPLTKLTYCYTKNTNFKKN